MSAIDYSQFVHTREGRVDRRIFSDPGIYKVEMEQIFARAWNFMCHESQIPDVGDFFMNRIGDDQVIVVRHKQQGISGLLNSCRHRGAAVCRAEQGRAKTFMCPYHGWSYGLDGALIGVPGLREFYRSDLKKNELGLGQAAQVCSYKGFVFATMDPAAPPPEGDLGGVGRRGVSVAKAGRSASTCSRSAARSRSSTESRRTSSTVTGRSQSTISSTGITRACPICPRFRPASLRICLRGTPSDRC